MSKSLNRVIVEEYLKDLRGGKFKQCRRALRVEFINFDAYCAVGLFALTYKRITGEDIFDIAYQKADEITGIYCIESKNDRGMSFSEIADYIEENSSVMMKEKVG